MEVLQRAVGKGKVQTVQQILAKHPDLLKPAALGGFLLEQRTALHVAVAAKGHLQKAKMVELLITKEPGLIPVICEKAGATALHMAAEAGYVEIVRMLIAKDPRAVSKCCVPFGQTPLHWAIRAGQEEVVGVFLKHDLKLIEAIDARGRNAFHLAAQCDQTKLVKLLSEYCLQHCSKTSPTGTTTTMKTQMKEETPVATKLLSVTDKFSNTVLHTAIHRGFVPELIGLLLELHPEAANVRNKEGKYPIELILACHDSKDAEERLELVFYALMRSMCFDDLVFSVYGGSPLCVEFLEKAVQRPLKVSVVLPEELMALVREYVDFEGRFVTTDSELF